MFLVAALLVGPALISLTLFVVRDQGKPMAFARVTRTCGAASLNRRRARRQITVRPRGVSETPQSLLTMIIGSTTMAGGSVDSATLPIYISC